MAELSVKKRADEERAFPKGSVRLSAFGDQTVGLIRFEPGWKWSEHVRPFAGTPTCQVQHHLYVISGRCQIRMDDGKESVVGPGDFALIPPGHDAWVVGGEPFLAVDFTRTGQYARPSAGAAAEAPQSVH